MLYQEKRPPSFRRRAGHLWLVVGSTLAAIGRSHADRAVLDGLNARQLEDIGLRRTADRDFRPL